VAALERFTVDSVPKYNELMPFILETLKANGGKMTCSSMFEEAQRKGFPAGPRLKKNRQKLLENRLGWARTYLRKAGAVTLVDRGGVGTYPEGTRA